MGLELDQEVSKLDIFKYNRQDSNYRVQTYNRQDLRQEYKPTIDSTASTSSVQKYNRQDSKYIQCTKIQ